MLVVQLPLTGSAPKIALPVLPLGKLPLTTQFLFSQEEGLVGILLTVQPPQPFSQFSVKIAPVTAVAHKSGVAFNKGI